MQVAKIVKQYQRAVLFPRHKIPIVDERQQHLRPGRRAALELIDKRAVFCFSQGNACIRRQRINESFVRRTTCKAP